MGVIVTCPNPECRTTYKVADDKLSGRARCKKCGATITVEIKRDETLLQGAPPPDQSGSAASAETEFVSGAPPADSATPLATTVGLSPSMLNRPGLPKIAPYICERRLGQGGMGEVFLAHDPRLDRKVAIKLLPPDLAHDKMRVERFLREARMAAKVQHANTVVIHEVDVRDGNAFLVMEFVEGQSLDKVIKSLKPMDWREATRAIRDAAAGLAAAHELGLVHRDVKPANLMRTRHGVTKVVDFGSRTRPEVLTANPPADF